MGGRPARFQKKLLESKLHLDFDFPATGIQYPSE
jgi:hypothetical protein